MLCIDAATGDEIWTADETMRGARVHRKNTGVSSSPAYGEVDGSGRVVVIYADAFRQIAVAYDTSGAEAWRADLGPYKSQHGQGSSPVIDSGRVYIANDQDGDSSIFALDLSTGEVLWQTPRKVSKAAYATPRVTSIAGREVLIVLSDAEGVAGLDPATGRMLFASGPQPERVVASPVIIHGGDTADVIISSGSGGTGKHMECVTVSRDGDDWSTDVRWTRSKGLPYVPTAVVNDGILFLWNDNGTLACVDSADGSTVWIERVGGKFSGSPLLAGGRLFAISESGDVAVVNATRTFKRHPGGRIADESEATPVAAAGHLYLRGFASLSALPLSK